MNALGQTISICRLREHGEHIYIINAGRLECQGLPSRLEGLAAVRDLIVQPTFNRVLTAAVGGFWADRSAAAGAVCRTGIDGCALDT